MNIWIAKHFAFEASSCEISRLPLKLLLVGGGSKQALLKKLAEELGIACDTAFTGHVEHSEVVAYHNMLTVSVFVSISHSESFGVSVIEAGACSKPVVVSNVGGLPEVVEENVTGFIVEVKNFHQTADAIEKMMLDETLRTRMGRAGRERVEKLFNWDDNVEQMISVYHEVKAAFQGKA